MKEEKENENAKNILAKNAANLLKVKTIISLLVILTTCLLTFMNKVDIAAFMAITASIVTYYFTKSDKEDKK